MVIQRSTKCIVTNVDEDYKLEKKCLYLRSLMEPKLTIEHQTPVQKNQTYRTESFKPALAVVAVPNQIRAVGTENTWHTTRAASGSISKTISEDSVGSGDRGVLVAHFVACVVEFVCCVWLVVLDLIWLSVHAVLLYIGKSSREGLVLTSQRNHVCDNEIVSYTKTFKTMDLFGQRMLQKVER
jgi:hypothetical protein